jgi:secreted protein with Ig-like and vWFA domain
MASPPTAVARPGPCRVFLLTDGQANAGITDPDAPVAMAASTPGRGVATTTIGFGADFAEDLLTAIRRKPNAPFLRSSVANLVETVRS